MSLNIYAGADQTNPFSKSGANTNPIRHAFDGRTGGVIERRYYVGNDSSATYTNVSVVLVPNTAKDIVNGTDGYTIKLKAGNTQPTAQEWDAIEEGDSISLADIPDTITFLPFWVRIVVPKGAPVDTISNMFIRVTGTAS